LTQREPGTVLDGKYEIVQRLGSGGMGEVYLVRHVHLQELRVVKILRQDLAADPAAQARFSREARLATQIKHPNVAILYDFDRLPDGSFYMVSEHIEGENVGDRLRRAGPYPVLTSLQLGIQALRGLGAIHAAGIVHRDLSPDNLMVTPEKSGLLRLKIIDLGLARTLEKDANLEITQTGTFMGKLQYCSPEQASLPQGGTVDHRSDLYSLGLVLYEMLVGVPPFESESGAGFIFKRLSEDPLPLRGRNPAVDIPEELDRVMRRALERHRDDRFPDAISFLVGLEGVLRSLDSVQTREVPVYQGPGARPTGPSSTALPIRGSSELSKAEKIDLLAQIERAGKKAEESAGAIAAIEAALAGGRLGEARATIARLEATNPRAPGLARAKEHLQLAERAFALPEVSAPPIAVAPSAEPARPVEVARPPVSQAAPPPPERREPQRATATGAATDGERIVEAERMFQRYLEKRQLPLARLALDTLLELAPAHPRSEELRRALSDLGVEDESSRRAETAAANARAALAAGDFKRARQQLDGVLANDPRGERSGALRTEIAEAERGRERSAVVDQQRKQFETLIAARRVVEARHLLEALEASGLPRVTLDFLQGQLDEARGAIQLEERLGHLEERYRRDVEDRSWSAAREVVWELEAAAPEHPRAAAMFAEVERLESEDRRRQGVEQGVQQVERFVAEGDKGRAELALKILLQMDPENRHRKRLEKAVKELRK
jgi:serine/threonine-protein kinase